MTNENLMDENKCAFVFQVTRQGPMCLNQYDRDPQRPDIGVSAELFRDGERFKGIGVLVSILADHRRKIRGDGVVIIDGGANIGTFTVPWSQIMMPNGRRWGSVIAFEPQYWPRMQLSTNVTLNNCYNVKVRHEALSHCCGSISCPDIHPLTVHNSGGVHMGENGQDGHVPMISIDSLDLPRLDIMKLDIEGMEPDALAGAKRTIARCNPIIIAEAALCGADRIMEALPDYAILGSADAVCVPNLPENAQIIETIAGLAKHLNIAAA